MEIEDRNVSSLLETKSTRAARTESALPSDSRANIDAVPTKWIKAALIGTLASFVMFFIVTGRRRDRSHAGQIRHT